MLIISHKIHSSIKYNASGNSIKLPHAWQNCKKHRSPKESCTEQVCGGAGTDTGAAARGTQEELCSFGIAQLKLISPSARAVPVLYRLHCATLTQSTGAGFTGAVPEWGGQDLTLQQKGQSLCSSTHMHHHFTTMRHFTEFKCLGSSKAQWWAQSAPPGSRLTDIHVSRAKPSEDLWKILNFPVTWIHTVFNICLLTRCLSHLRSRVPCFLNTNTLRT